LLNDEVTWAVNRIWKIFDRTDWRPTHYVRAEIPEYNEEHVKEDALEMMNQPSNLWFQEGFRGLSRRAFMHKGIEYFKTCTGGIHDWHMPLVCGYGTVVHVAMQLAILQGATELYLVGCDLGIPDHFYGKEGTNNDVLAFAAHKIAVKCCPVPVYNSTVGGLLELYPRKKIEDVIYGEEKERS